MSPRLSEDKRSQPHAEISSYIVDNYKHESIAKRNGQHPWPSLSFGEIFPFFINETSSSPFFVCLIFSYIAFSSDCLLLSPFRYFWSASVFSTFGLGTDFAKAPPLEELTFF